MNKAWATDLDLSGKGVGSAWWAWGVLLAGALGLALSAQRYEQAVTANAQAQQQLESAQQRLSAALATRTVAHQQTALSTQALAGIDRVLAALKYPWGVLLGSVERALVQADAAALVMDYQASTGRLHLEVQGDAVALLHQLNAQGLWQQAGVTSRATSDAALWRASLDAQWSRPLNTSSTPK